MAFKIEMGSKVKDKITGLVGVVTSQTNWITGCASYGVQPAQLKDGEPVKASWIDENRLEVIGAPTFKADAGKEFGGPHDLPQMHR